MQQSNYICKKTNKIILFPKKTGKSEIDLGVWGGFDQKYVCRNGGLNLVVKIYSI